MQNCLINEDSDRQQFFSYSNKTMDNRRILIYSNPNRTRCVYRISHPVLPCISVKPGLIANQPVPSSECYTERFSYEVTEFYHDNVIAECSNRQDAIDLAAKSE